MLKLDRRQWKKVLLYSSLSLIIALIITITCMAAVMVQFFPTANVGGIKTDIVNLSDAAGMTIYFDKKLTKNSEFPTSWKVDLKDDDGNYSGQFKFSEVQKIFEKSFKGSFLTASTNGASVNKKFTVERESTTVNTVVGNSDYCVYYRFDTVNRFIYNPDGSFYRYQNRNQQIYGILISCSKEDKGFGEVEIYFCTSSSSSGTENTSLTTVVKAYANYSKLMKYLEEYCSTIR